MDADQIKQWFDDFMMTDGTVVPPDKRMMLALYYDDRALRLAARINDPMMDRLLLNAVRYADGLVKRPSEPVPAGFDEQLRAIRYDEDGGGAG